MKDTAGPGGAGRAQDKRQQSRESFVMRVYALLALLSFSVFGSLHIFVEKNFVVGYLELTGAVVVAVSMIGFKLTGNVAVARAYLLMTMLALLMVMLVTGGTHGTGILWFFMFPVAAFFLAGTREGSYWMALLFAGIIAAWVIGVIGVIPLYYEGIEVRQLLVTLAVVTVGLHVYQRYRERSARQAKESRDALEANLLRTTELHAKVDKAKTEFVTLASHQLRTPISAVNWFSEMLLNNDAGKLTDAQRECVQGIEDSNRRLGVIVDSLLLVSSLDLGKFEVQPEAVDLSALARRVLGEERKKNTGRRLDVREDYEAGLPKVRLDSRITSIILRNVLSNAFKYTPDGGQVKLAIKRRQEHQDDSLLFEVSDTGYGIPVEQQADIFSKMFRAGNIKHKDTDGTGLGLYIVKSLLELAGGKVWFESEEGKGTTFWFTLPVSGMKTPEDKPQPER